MEIWNEDLADSRVTLQGAPEQYSSTNCCLLDLTNTVTENQWLCILLD